MLENMAFTSATFLQVITLEVVLFSIFVVCLEVEDSVEYQETYTDKDATSVKLHLSVWVYV